MVAYAVQHKLYTHLPPAIIFTEVECDSLRANGIIATELESVCGVAPTPSTVAYYRSRVETWLRLLGLDLCLELMTSHHPDSLA